MEQILDKEICNVLDDRQMNYSVYVAKHRAIPSLYDGLKPSYRRILYTMRNTKENTKSANVEGAVMLLHPHGSSYPTMVNMAQKDTNIIPLINGKGNFGQHTSKDLQYASSRYTEVKISNYALDMMRGFDKNIVDFIPSYDNERVEPTLLPVRHPLILTLAQKGMAVGYATDIPSFNLKEVCEACISYLNGEDIPNLYPDFATKGYILKNDTSIEEINNSGKGSFRMRGKYEVKDNHFYIKEIPFNTTREEIITKVIELCKQGKFKEVIDIDDTSDINGIEIDIQLRKGTNIESFVQKLCKVTSFETSYSCNMNVLAYNENQEIELQVLGVKSIIPKWIDWRRECIKRTLVASIEEDEKKLHLLNGLEKCLIDIDKVIDIIRHSENEEIEQELMTFLKVDKEQADFICKINLRDINKVKIEKKIAEIDSLKENVQKFKEEVEDKSKLDNYIKQGLLDTIKKYSKPRLTEIIEVESSAKIKIVEDYNCRVYLTEQGYIKKYLRSHNGKLKEGDKIFMEVSSNNNHDLLLFTDKANVFYLKCDDLELSQPNSLGTYLPTVLPLEDNEKLIYILSTKDYKGNIMFAFENGKVAVVELASYKTKNNRTKVVNAYSTHSRLINIIIGQPECVCISSLNKVLIVDMSRANSKVAKNSQGVQIMKSKDESTMVDFYPLSKLEEFNSSLAIEELRSYYKKSLNSIGNYILPEHKGIF